ncbi:hypothetical protein Tco_0011111 [Tanacetum coccineum]
MTSRPRTRVSVQDPFGGMTTSPTYTKAPWGYRAAEIWLGTASPPPLPLSSPLPLPPPIILPHTRASIVMMRTTTPSTYILAPQSGILPSGTPPLLPIPLPTSLPPLLLPSTDCRADVLEESSSAPTARPTGGFKANYDFVGTLDAEIRRDLDRKIGYGITDIWEDPDEITEELPASDVTELGQRMTDFVTTVRQYTDEIYVRLDDAQSDRSLRTGQPNLLRRDRRSYARTARLIESEAIATRSRPQATSITHRGTYSAKDIEDLDGSTTEALISRGMADALVEQEIQRNNNLNGDGSQGSGSGITRPVRPTRECTYTDFLKCQPMNLRWKSHVKTVGQDAAHGMPWNTLMKMVTTKYCPRNEIKKLEMEI